jgi:hypothetical protein
MASHEDIKDVLVEVCADPLALKIFHPVARLFGIVLGTPERTQIRHAYQTRLVREFHEAERAYHHLCDFPFGLLTKVYLLRVNAVKELAQMADYVREIGITEHVTTIQVDLKAKKSHLGWALIQTRN